MRLEDTYCWSRPVRSPFDAEVIESRDGCKERNPLHPVREIAHVLSVMAKFRWKRNADVKDLLGNYIILKGHDAYALLAHARCGSASVTPGQQVLSGDQIAEVGHSGNSTAPHLHFQLMDRPTLLDAEGILCCYIEYESYSTGEWVYVKYGIPGKGERIRSIGTIL